MRIESDHIDRIPLNYKPSTGFWYTKENIEVVLSDGETLTIPSGFKTDLSSSPRFLWWAFPPYGPFLIAAIIHDYLYVTDYKRQELGTSKAKRFADKQMLLFSNLVNKNKFDNLMRYWAVYLFGRKVYLK